MTSVPAFQVDLNFNVIQSLRLLHALLESHGDVRVDPHTLPKLSRLREVFGAQVSDEVEGVPVLPGLEIDHEGEPKTRIREGSSRRTPHDDPERRAYNV